MEIFCGHGWLSLLASVGGILPAVPLKRHFSKKRLCAVNERRNALPQRGRVKVWSGSKLVENGAGAIEMPRVNR
jgi:hypothetical protein